MSPRKPRLPGNAGDRLSATYNYLFGKKSTDRGSKARINRDVRDTMVSSELRQEMVDVLLSASNLGLCPARISEASIRIQDNTFLVTKRNSWFNQLTDQDLILVMASVEGEVDKDQSPKHWNWHLSIYLGDPNTKAVVMGQPAALMALASQKKLPEDRLLPDAGEIIGQIKLCQPNGKNIAQEAQQARLLVVPGIGALARGETISEAVTYLELANQWSELTIMARK